MTAVFLINRIPSSVLNGKSPFEIVHGIKPDYKLFRTFGCLCFAANLNVHDKFGSRATKCVFLGYAELKKAYKLYNLETGCMFYSRDVQFCENVFPFKLNNSSGKPISKEAMQFIRNFPFYEDCTVNDEVVGPSNGIEQEASRNDATDCQNLEAQNEEATVQSYTSGENDDDSSVHEPGSLATRHLLSETVPVRKSVRQVKVPTKLKDYEVTLNCSNVKYPLACWSLQCMKNKISEPNSVHDALMDPAWKQAMDLEMKALLDNDTWSLVDLPLGRKPIGCKWVFRVKYKSDGTVERYKARLVAKGYSQREGLDFHETFSPVVKMVTIRSVIALAVIKGWTIFQLDVNNAFLHGDLHECVYMTPPEGFEYMCQGKVCKLNKSLYGLKQAPRQWNEKLKSAMIDFGFTQSLNDYSLFMYVKESINVFALVYVDDILLTGNCNSVVNSFKRFLDDKFKIKDLGTLHFFLGIEAVSIDKGICLSQKKYTVDLIAEFGLTACKPASVPMDQGIKLTNDVVDNDPYLSKPNVFQRLIGKLIYLTITRPDISFAVHVLSQFMHAPKESHFTAALKVLKYLKCDPSRGIMFVKDSMLCLRAFCDSDWASCPMSRKSVTGYCIFLGLSLISYKSKK